MKFLHMWHVCDVKMSTHMQNFSYFVKNQFFCDLHSFIAKLSCRDLRTFVWRKIYPKIALGKPLGTISAVQMDFCHEGGEGGLVWVWQLFSKYKPLLRH